MIIISISISISIMMMIIIIIITMTSCTIIIILVTITITIPPTSPDLRGSKMPDHRCRSPITITSIISTVLVLLN